MTIKILCVDDEPKVLRGLRRQLYDKFELEFAAGSEIALDMLANSGPFAVVLADMRMPVMDGAQLLAEISRRSPDTVRIMLTGNSDLLTAVRAVNEGRIFRFLNKPCDPNDLENALRDGLEQHRLVCAEKDILEQTLNGCVRVLTEVLSLADPKGFQHTDELKELAGEVGAALQMPHPWELQMAVMLAQLGRVSVPPEVLARAEAGESLKVAERKMLASIPAVGADMIQNIPRLEGVARMVREQAMDPQADGDGSPDMGARALRVMQEMVRMVGTGLDRQAALACMSEKPERFDPTVVQAIASSLGLGITTGTGTRQVTFDGLLPGDVLAAPLVTREERLILGKGHRIGRILLGRLRNHQQVSPFREPIHIESREADTPQCTRKTA